MCAFSVIIPVFNAELTLATCLESVKKQTFTDYEIIIVDDGSTDSSRSIAEGFEEDFDRLIILTQPNKGLGNARNMAVKQAKGEWLAFLDADDTWQANKLEIISQFILSNEEAEFIYHAIFERYGDGRIRKRTLDPILNLQQFVQTGNPIVPSATVIRRSIFDKFGGFVEDRTQVEDILLWMKMLHAGVQFLPIDKPLTVYAIGEGVTADIEDHLTKVDRSLQQALAEKLISHEDMDVIRNRKNYEAARQMQKLGQHAQASLYYQNTRDQGLKQRVLILANKLRISI